MKIITKILKVVLLSLLLLSVLSVFRQPNKKFYQSTKGIYGAGSASDATRREIKNQLDLLQDGYSKRDLSQVDAFVEQLFSGENVLVLGTMPDEIYDTPRDVEKLVYADWNAWGDCTFLIDTANISASGNTAWFSTIGYVKFDLPSFLVMPLRLSGVLVKENADWKIQFLQFQFDLNLFFLFFTVVLLFVWLIVSLAGLIFDLFRRRKAQPVKEDPASQR